MKKIINIEGMTCSHCVGRVNKALSGIDGINKVDVNLDDKKAFITMDKEVADKLLETEIENIGFEVAGINPG